MREIQGSTAIDAGEFIAVLGSRGPAIVPTGVLRPGMERFTSLSRALAGEAPASGVLLLDEPFAGLDSPTRLELQETLLRFWEGAGLTVVLVTHDVDEALYMADRIFLVTGGDGSPVSNVLEVPFARPRARDEVIDDSRYRLFRKRVTDLLDAGEEAPAPEPAPPVDPEFRGLRPKPDRRQGFAPMPPALDRRSA
jgi:ATPase subunit of ABC transporter with duplicated ATPase domains